mgnify:CR=1 FL=1
MLKKFTPVLVLGSLISVSCFATQPYSSATQEVVRTTLWHVGIEAEVKKSQVELKDGSHLELPEMNYPEELIVALDKLEAEKS